jgi:hypothetical protein
LVGWSQDTSHEPRFSRAAMLSCSIGAAALAIAVTMWSGAVRLRAQDDLLTCRKAMYAGLRSCPDTDHGICHHESDRCGRHYVGATISDTSACRMERDDRPVGAVRTRLATRRRIVWSLPGCSNTWWRSGVSRGRPESRDENGRRPPDRPCGVRTKPLARRTLRVRLARSSG